MRWSSRAITHGRTEPPNSLASSRGALQARAVNSPRLVYARAVQQPRAVHLPGREAGELAGEQHRDLLHDRVTDAVVVFHQRDQLVAVERDDITGREAERGGDALLRRLDQRRPAEHVPAPDH